MLVTGDMNYRANVDWMAHLELLEITFERIIVEGVPHDHELIRENVGDVIMGLHERCF